MESIEKLKELKERYQLALVGTDAGIWDWNITNNVIFFSDRWKSMLGYESDEIGNTYMEWESRVHPDDLPACLVAIDNYLEGKYKEFYMEHRLLCKDGTYVWIYSKGAALRDENGKPYRFIGSHIDITRQKKIEYELKQQHKTLQTLLEIQEKERKLISCEIHDGLAQQLAGLVMMLEKVRVKPECQDACDLIANASNLAHESLVEARRLIGGLRPPILDEGGAIPAILEILGESPLEVEASIHCPGRFEPLLENCLFRIVQEGLQNAAKHSESKKIKIELKLDNEIIFLKIKDWGKGFDVNSVADGHFGLIGIRERVESFNGHCNIISSAEKGTTIMITLPIGFENGIPKN